MRCAREWGNRQLKSAIAPLHTRDVAHGEKARITIGYLSADFYPHATSWLIAELFEKHDRDRFQIVGYSYGREDDGPMRRRLVRALDRFVDVKDASFLEAARRIAEDGIDILVDLKGYTQHSRTPILALRPAPIQVNYLGFPGTMGVAFMDYVLVDDFVVPAEEQPCFTCGTSIVPVSHPGRSEWNRFPLAAASGGITLAPVPTRTALFVAVVSCTALFPSSSFGTRMPERAHKKEESLTDAL